MKVIVCFALVITLIVATDVDTTTEFTGTEIWKDKGYWDFGQKFWAEILIGFAISAPITWAKLYFPIECGKLISLVINDLFEAAMYTYELSMLQEGWLIIDRDLDFDTYTINRNVYYLVADNISIAMSMPSLINECAYNGEVGIV